MGRPPDGTQARERVISVRADGDDLARLDKLRGSSTRSDYIRRLLRREEARVRQNA